MPRSYGRAGDGEDEEDEEEEEEEIEALVNTDDLGAQVLLVRLRGVGGGGEVVGVEVAEE